MNSINQIKRQIIKFEYYYYSINYSEKKEKKKKDNKEIKLIKTIIKICNSILDKLTIKNINKL